MSSVVIYYIKYYVNIYQCRANRPGGGVSLFIKERSIFNRRKDLDVNNSYIESLFIELPKEKMGHK